MVMSYLKSQVTRKIVWLGPIEAHRPLAWFGPKQNTKMGLHHPPNTNFYQFQDTQVVLLNSAIGDLGKYASDQKRENILCLKNLNK